MITKDQMIEYLLVNSGQYLLGDFVTTSGMEEKYFIALVKSVLVTYSNFIPVEKRKTMKLFNGLKFDGKNGQDIPQFIVEIRNKNQNVVGNILFGTNKNSVISKHHWEFNSDNSLSFRYPQGYYEVHYAVNHKYDEETHSIDTLSEGDPLFLDLFTAQMMLSIGKSRRAFLLNDLPFTIDADSLVSEGESLKDSTMEKLKERSRHYLGY